MPYGAILRNDFGYFWKGRPFFVDFGTEQSYRDTVSKRKYLGVVQAPATEQDFLDLIMKPLDG